MKNKRYFNLTLKLTIFIFVVMTLSTSFVGGIGVILYQLNFLGLSYLAPIYIIMPSLFISTILGTVLSMILSRHSVNKIDRLVKGLSEIGQGNFAVRLDSIHKKHSDQVTDNFNKMAQELSSIEVMRSNFVSNFSHEFKTPIVSIQGFAKLLKDTNLSEEQRIEYLDIIIDESSRLSVLAHNTLILSKLESQEMISDKRTYSLDEQIRQCILLLESSWQSKKINLQISLPTILMINNENLIEQLWINIIGNAIKFSYDGGTVAISATTALNNAIITVSDNGIGMDELTAEHIFDKYYQGDSSHATQGNGLGLSIVHRIIDLCGGNIRVKTKPNGGSTFIISLPLGNSQNTSTNNI